MAVVAVKMHLDRQLYSGMLWIDLFGRKFDEWNGRGLFICTDDITVFLCLRESYGTASYPSYDSRSTGTYTFVEFDSDDSSIVCETRICICNFVYSDYSQRFFDLFF
jgi:hypothetical protein